LSKGETIPPCLCKMGNPSSPPFVKERSRGFSKH
jgi:hypothetical protein